MGDQQKPLGDQIQPETPKKAPKIVDLDDQVKAEVSGIPPEQGTRFFFGEIGEIKLQDGTKFLAKRRRETITDSDLAKKIEAVAKNYKISVE